MSRGDCKVSVKNNLVVLTEYPNWSSLCVSEQWAFVIIGLDHNYYCGNESKYLDIIKTLDKFSNPWLI